MDTSSLAGNTCAAGILLLSPPNRRPKTPEVSPSRNGGVGRRLCLALHSTDEGLLPRQWSIDRGAGMGGLGESRGLTDLPPSGAAWVPARIPSAAGTLARSRHWICCRLCDWVGRPASCLPQKCVYVREAGHRRLEDGPRPRPMVPVGRARRLLEAPSWDQLPMAMRLALDFAAGVLGMVTVSSPFLNVADTLSSSTSSTGMRRSK
jgi:hypothetical protein